MTEDQKNAIDHAQKILSAVKLYDLAASIADTAGLSEYSALKLLDALIDIYDTVQGTWERGTKFYTAPPAPSVADAAGAKCTCGSNPHAENCPVTANVRALFAASGESARAAPSVTDAPHWHGSHAEVPQHPIAYLSTEPRLWDQCRVKPQASFTVPVFTHVEREDPPTLSVADAEPVVIWRAIAEDAECIIERGVKKILLTEEMCVRLGTSVENVSAELTALRDRVAEMEKERYREAGVWGPDGSKFKTYRDENLNGKAMYVKEMKS